MGEIVTASSDRRSFAIFSEEFITRIISVCFAFSRGIKCFTMQKKVVVLGGGTGTFTVLSSLKSKGYELTALLTMADDGGSNKVLRDDFGLLPTSGVRLAMVALSSQQSLLRELFTYRFHQGGVSGMTFGNLFIAAVSDIVGSQEKAIEATSELLSVSGKILPISYESIKLVAEYENGLKVTGEHEIDEPKHDGKLKIKNLSTVPAATIDSKAEQEILNADYIIIGPGDFYTNTVANLVIDGVVSAIMRSKAKVIFITNLMTKYGEAYDYKASDYFHDLKKYMPIERINFILVNNDLEYPEGILKKYEEEDSKPVEDDLDTMSLPDSVEIIRAPIILKKEVVAEKGDVLKRSMIRHSQKKLGQKLAEIIGE